MKEHFIMNYFIYSSSTPTLVAWNLKWFFSSFNNCDKNTIVCTTADTNNYVLFWLFLGYQKNTKGVRTEHVN